MVKRMQIDRIRIVGRDFCPDLAGFHIVLLDKDLKPVSQTDIDTEDEIKQAVYNVIDLVFQTYLEKKDEKSYAIPEVIRWNTPKKYRTSELECEKVLYKKSSDDWMGYPFVCQLLYSVKKSEEIPVVVRELIDWIVSNDEKVSNDETVSIGKVTVELTIGSRLDEGQQHYFLVRMLEASTPDPYISNLLISDRNSGASELDYAGSMKALWETLLVYQFEKSLTELYHLGFFKTYVGFNKNDFGFKGMLDISRHIKLNGPLGFGKTAYSFRERSTDNSLNHLILKTYDVLKKRFPKSVTRSMNNDQYKKIIYDLRMNAPSGETKTERQLLSENMKPIMHPFFFRYEWMRRICIRVLRHDGMGLLLDKNKTKASVDGFVIYVPDLFEDYVEECLRKNMPKETQVDPQKSIKDVRPDFVLDSGYVVDAKYRPGYDDFLAHTAQVCQEMVSNADLERGTAFTDRLNLINSLNKDDGRSYVSYFQDIDKLIRDVKLVATNGSGAIVYPIRAGKQINKSIDTEQIMPRLSDMLKIQDVPRLSFVPIVIPPANGSEYDVWKGEMDSNAATGIEQIKNGPASAS